MPSQTARRTPIWKSIAESLRFEIGEGHYRPGDKLPTEAALSARFGVNRHTVRRSLAALSDEGLLHSRRGSGVYVSHSPTDYPLGPRVRFHQNLRAAGRSPDRKLLNTEHRMASTEECAALQLPKRSRVFVIYGVSLADGRPLCLSQSAFPSERLPDLPEQLEKHNSITLALQEVGVSDYLRASTRITAKLATATQALHLQISEGDPILRSVSINTDLAEIPVEYGQTWFAGDRVCLTLDKEHA